MTYLTRRAHPEAISARIKRSVPYGTLKEWAKALKRRAGLASWRGDRYRCPICRTGLRAFKPIWRSFWIHWQQYESVHSPLAMETFNVGAFSCPACNAFDRERLTALYLERAFHGFDPQRKYRLIEFAPAHALHRMIRAHPFVAYRSADLLSRHVDDRVDLTACPYPDRSVDVFLCSHVLEHIEDDRKAMRELNRILTPDGFGILLVPLFPGIDETHEDPAITAIEERAKYFAAGDHVRQYGKRDFIERLTAAGFQVEQCGIDYFGKDAFMRAGIAPNSVLYVVRKGHAPIVGA
jgi:SAM-dependent methyltransferase